METEKVEEKKKIETSDKDEKVEEKEKIDSSNKDEKIEENEEVYITDKEEKLTRRGAKIYMQSRELSWLRFNERVLEEANSDLTPALEKLKFIAIFTSNLTEYFMVRVGRLSDYALIKGDYIDNKTKMTPEEQLKLIYKDVKRLYKKKDEIYSEVEKNLRRKGIRNLKIEELDDEENKYVKNFFKKFIKPILSPQIIDFHNPFPFLENDRPYIAVEIDQKGEKSYGLVITPQAMPKYIRLPGKRGKFTYVLMENILHKYAKSIFKGYKITDTAIINVTRNSDLSADDEAAEDSIDYKSYMKKILKKRNRLNPVRLESDRPLSDSMKKFFMEKLIISEEQIYVVNSPIHMDYAFDLEGEKLQNIEEILYPAFSPERESQIKGGSIIKAIEKKDYLFAYPYESMDIFVNLIKEAAESKDVISIKITIYRLAKNSKLVEYLCKAAENGKNVTVLMELKARFDEKQNLDYAQILYDAGCNIVYGFDQFKVHSKICLITYRQNNEIENITQIGTGNYNEKTAKQYTDFSFITADPMIGQDATEFFFNVCTGIVNGSYEKILQSPFAIKEKILELIEREMKKGKEGYIFLKMNSLTDYDLIKKLRDASEKGVQIKLIIRGISCLLPGVKDNTENIEIRSIVGRFLEHPRVYIFGQNEDQQIYISSADLMTRNMERRVEIASPIRDRAIRAEILHYMDTQWEDDLQGRRMGPDGKYYKIKEDGSLDCQKYFIDYYKKKEVEDIKIEEKKESFFRRILNKIKGN